MTTHILGPLSENQADLAWTAQAIFTVPLSRFARPGCPEIADVDELDRYRAVAGTIDGIPFVVRAYAGYPKDSVQMSLPSTVTDEAEGRGLITAAMAIFGLDESDRAWRRGDVVDPQAFVADLRERQTA